jgi:hypothetical protein
MRATLACEPAVPNALVRWLPAAWQVHTLIQQRRRTGHHGNMPSHNFIDLTGRCFFRLTVVGRNPQNAIDGRTRWNCVCACGTAVTVLSRDLISGKTKSCGCWNRESSRLRGLKHGHAPGGKRSTELGRWSEMIQRCYNPNHKLAKHYFLRGIRVCDEWRNSFEAYLAHIRSIGFTGAPGQSLDRIDNNGHYEPGNLRVTDQKGQCRNKTNNRLVEAFGERLCVTEWAERTGVNQDTIRSRIERGWLPERALSTPVRTITSPRLVRVGEEDEG